MYSITNRLYFIAFAFVLGVVGCTDDSGHNDVGTGSAPFDPRGAWTATMTIDSAGTCGVAGSSTSTIYVVDDVDGYRAIDPDMPSAEASFDCTTFGCEMTLVETGQNADGTTISLHAVLRVDDHYSIAGTGSVNFAFTNGSFCAQALSFVGTFAPGGTADAT